MNNSSRAIRHSVPHVVPHQLAHNDTKAGITMGRELVRKQFPDLPYNPTKRIARMKLPVNGVYDYSRAYLLIECNCTRVGGTYVRFPDGIWNIIRQVRLLEGTKELMLINHYGYLHSIIWEMGHQPGSEATLGFSLYGIANQATRNGWATGKQYVLPFLFELLTAKVLDYAHLRHALTMEITFQDPAALLETDALTYSWEVTDLNMYTDHMKKAHREYRRKMRGLNTLHYQVEHYRPYITNLTSAALNYTIPHTSQAMTGLMIVMRDLNTVSDPTVNNKFKTYNRNNATFLRIKLNEEYLPEEPLALGAPYLLPYMAYLNFLGHWEAAGEYGNVVPLNVNQYANNKFVLFYDFEDHPHFYEKYLNMREAHPDSNFTLELTFAAPPATTQEVMVWIHTSAVVIKKAGLLNVIE